MLNSETQLLGPGTPNGRLYCWSDSRRIDALAPRHVHGVMTGNEPEAGLSFINDVAGRGIYQLVLDIQCQPREDICANKAHEA